MRGWRVSGWRVRSRSCRPRPGPVWCGTVLVSEERAGRPSRRGRPGRRPPVRWGARRPACTKTSRPAPLVDDEVNLGGRASAGSVDDMVSGLAGRRPFCRPRPRADARARSWSPPRPAQFRSSSINAAKTRPALCRGGCFCPRTELMPHQDPHSAQGHTHLGSAKRKP